MFEALCSYPVLTEAFRRAKRGKRNSDVIRQYQVDLHDNLATLRRDLLAGHFTFGEYRIFQVFEPKARIIAVPPFREHILHHAIILVCGEVLERALVDHCCACRVGKGQWYAVKLAARLARRYEWCLKLDMRRYFDSINHAILLNMLERKLSDKRLLLLLEGVVASYAVAPGRGLPIGNLTSQYFANLYLDPLDRFIDDVVGVRHVRYMDDLLVYGAHNTLLELFKTLPGFLMSRLKLSLKAGGGLHRSARGVDFLGVRFFPYGVVGAKHSRLRLKRKLKLYALLYARGRISESVYQTRLRALYAWYHTIHKLNRH